MFESVCNNNKPKNRWNAHCSHRNKLLWEYSFHTVIILVLFAMALSTAWPWWILFIYLCFCRGHPGSQFVKRRQKLMIICISTLRWMSSRWEMNKNFFQPIISQIDVRRIERLLLKKKKKKGVISKYLLSEECVLSLWLWFWDWEMQQKQFESILL